MKYHVRPRPSHLLPPEAILCKRWRATAGSAGQRGAKKCPSEDVPTLLGFFFPITLACCLGEAAPPQTAMRRTSGRIGPSPPSPSPAGFIPAVHPGSSSRHSARRWIVSRRRRLFFLSSSATQPRRPSGREKPATFPLNTVISTLQSNHGCIENSRGSCSAGKPDSRLERSGSPIHQIGNRPT